MPTINEILTDIDDRYSNNFTTEQKIRWLNQVQRDVFREIALQGILTFKTVPELAVYEEVKDIDFDLIENVTVDGQEYELKGLKDSLDTYSYMKVLDNYMALYPKPQTVMDVYVYYQRRPTTITVDNLTSTPELKEDYQEILKYGVFIIMAKARGDSSLANAYIDDYLLMLKKIKDDRKPSTDTKIEDVYGILGGMV